MGLKPVGEWSCDHCGKEAVVHWSVKAMPDDWFSIQGPGVGQAYLCSKECVVGVLND